MTNPYAELLDTYLKRGGKDLGEFLMGSRARGDVAPPPEPSHMLGDFEGVMAHTGGKFPRLCEALGMKGSSLKRMIGTNRIDKADVLVKMETALGFAPGSREDAQFWHLARGDKTLPDLGTVMRQAQNAMRRKGADAHAVARELGLKLFERSGYTHEKFGELSGRQGMIKEMTRHEGYRFSRDRAMLFAGAITIPGEEPGTLGMLAQLLQGLDMQKRPGGMGEAVAHGELRFGAMLKRLRAQRGQTQEQFAESFTAYLAEKAKIVPPATITKSMANSWEADLVPVQRRDIADALADFIGLKAKQRGIVPCPVRPQAERNTKEEWLAKIRRGEVRFQDYTKAQLEQEGLSYEAFGHSVPHGEKGVSEAVVSGWLKGKLANAEHAEALATRAGYAEPEERKDFVAFARTGRFSRSDRADMINQLLLGEIQIPEFVLQLRSEEGMSPEEFDRMVGLGKGASRNMEAGRELRSEAGAHFARYFAGGDSAKYEALRQRVIHKGSLGPSSTGLDPQGYRELIDACTEHLEDANLHRLRQQTPHIRFAHHDPVVERWWRALAAEHTAERREENGHIPQHLVDGWNDLHDLVFGTVNMARLTSSRFKQNVELVAQHLSRRDDNGAARRAVTATLVRRMHDTQDHQQRNSIAHIACLMELPFLQYMVPKGPRIDEAEALDVAQDKVHTAIMNNKVTDLSKIEHFFARVARNGVIDLYRKRSRHHEVELDMEVLKNLEGHAPAADPLATKPSDVMEALNAVRPHLSPKDALLLEAIIECEPGQRGLYSRLAEKLGMREGTVRSRIHHLRGALAREPELIEMLGDMFGQDYAKEVSSRSPCSGDRHTAPGKM